MSDKQDDNRASIQKTPKVKKQRPRWVSILLTLLTILRVPFLCVVALAVGLWIGYVKLGGQSMSDMFHLQTWKHLFDLIFVN
jgi:hypothetical protein